MIFLLQILSIILCTNKNKKREKDCKLKDSAANIVPEKTIINKSNKVGNKRKVHYIRHKRISIVHKIEKNLEMMANKLSRISMFLEDKKKLLQTYKTEKIQILNEVHAFMHKFKANSTNVVSLDLFLECISDDFKIFEIASQNAKIEISNAKKSFLRAKRKFEFTEKLCAKYCENIVLGYAKNKIQQLKKAVKETRKEIRSLKNKLKNVMSGFVLSETECFDNKNELISFVECNINKISEFPIKL